MRVVVAPPQELADDHTLIAQRYGGFFVGHPYRAAQQKTGPGAIVVDRTRPWVEPAVVADRCEFCLRLTDAEAIRRVAGYQHAIDIEVIRPYASRYSGWLLTSAVEEEDIAIADSAVRRGVMNSAINRRRFLESCGGDFQHQAISMVDLPLRLKRKLCIEWNHLYVKWMAEHGLTYDHDAQEFFRDAPAGQPGTEQQDAKTDAFTAWWGAGLRVGEAGGVAR
jgi:hypothetical protein